MPQSLRPNLVSIALAAGTSLAVAVVVVTAARPTVLVTSPAGAGVSAASSAPGIQARVIASGYATVSKRPDIAYVYAGVQSQQTTAAGAQSDLAAKAGRLVARVKSLGIADSDITTSGYSLGPSYSPGSQAISGYQASEQLQLKWHNVDTVGKALDALVQEGGATNLNVAFGLADPKAAQAEARTLAIADARSRAQAMATAAGVKLGAVVTVSDMTVSGYPMIGGASVAAPAATQLPIGQLDVTVTVEMGFAIA